MKRTEVTSLKKPTITLTFCCDMLIATEGSVQASAKPATARAPTAHPLAQGLQVKIDNRHFKVLTSSIVSHFQEVS